MEKFRQKDVFFVVVRNSRGKGLGDKSYFLNNSFFKYQRKIFYKPF